VAAARLKQARSTAAAPGSLCQSARARAGESCVPIRRQEGSGGEWHGRLPGQVLGESSGACMRGSLQWGQRHRVYPWKVSLLF
jgi:hypothetical protein